MARLAVGDEIEILVGKYEITLRKVGRQKFDLAELVAKMPRGYGDGEEAFGRPAGHEVW